MKSLLVRTIGTTSMLVTNVSLAQNGNMMQGGNWSSGLMGGSFGGWVPTLLVIVVIGLVVWIVKRDGK